MPKKIVFVVPPSFSHRTPEENLGVGYLAAIVRNDGYEAVVLDASLSGWGMNTLIQKIEEVANPLMIGISSYVYALSEVVEIVSGIKRAFPSVPIVAGGFGPTFHPEEFLDAGCHYVLRGESEESLLKLALLVSRKHGALDQIEGLSWKNEGGQFCQTDSVWPVAKLDALPLPSRDTLPESMSLKNPAHLVTSRGCNGHCVYCSVSAFARSMKGTVRWRERSIGSIIQEITYLHDYFGISCFKFVDDSFIEPPRDERWAEKFAQELNKRNLRIRFRTQIRSDRVSESLIQILSSVGWFATSVGVENFSASALRRMGKQANIEDNIRTLSLLERNGVYVQMGLILFDADTVLEELDDNLIGLKGLHWPVTKGIFTEMYASEGTPFVTRLENDGNKGDIRHGNYSYRIKDENALLVYSALKAWHKSHSSVYDHAINPISAPKNLPQEGYKAYHGASLKMYGLDIEFFEKVMTLVKSGVSNQEIDSSVCRLIEESQSVYKNLGDKLIHLDSSYGLAYETKPNPFLV